MATRIYNYGAKAPVTHLDNINKQLRLAHQYKNAIRALDLRRRKHSDTALLRNCPELLPLKQAAADADAAYDLAQNTLREANREARSRIKLTPQQRDDMRQLAKNAREAAKAYKEVRDPSWKRPNVQADLKLVADKHIARTKRLRRRIVNMGLYWGTYLACEDAMKDVGKGPPPRFKSYSGDGKIGVQIQGGLSVAQAFGGKDTRLRIDLSVDMKVTAGVSHMRRTIARIRIGSTEREPLWAEIPVEFHRPLPAWAKIKWVYLLSRKVATHTRWYLQFVVTGTDAEAMKPDLASTGAFGIDPGWRRVESGLRVAYWVGSDGDKAELVIKDEDLGRWSKADSLKSIRDRNFNEAREQLRLWIESFITDKNHWLVTETEYLPKWKSAKRMSDLVDRWRGNEKYKIEGNRFDGDEEIIIQMEAWRKQDKHLYEWQTNQLRKAVAWRDNLYRNFAAVMRRRYATVVIENINWAELARKAEIEEATSDDVGARLYRTIASSGRLVEILIESIRHHAKYKAEDTTRECNNCNNVESFDAAKELFHTCSKCGTVWDQDENAAKNLLAALSDPDKAPTEKPEKKPTARSKRHKKKGDDTSTPQAESFNDVEAA